MNLLRKKIQPGKRKELLSIFLNLDCCCFVLLGTLKATYNTQSLYFKFGGLLENSLYVSCLYSSSISNVPF